MMKTVSLVILLACSLMACVSSKPKPPLARVVGGLTFNKSGEYVIGSGDVIEINVVNNPNYSGEYVISPSGVLQHPLLRFRAAGNTLNQIQRRLRQAILAYVQSPKVSVNIKSFASYKFSIDGEIEKPGVYPIANRYVSLPEAIAQAGGMTPYSRRKVWLTRRQWGKIYRYRFDYDQVVTEAMASVYVERGDFILIK